ncbi:MAG: hypothetical protein F4Y76_10385 [Acidimicrobiales bacterium]|nr:hypothetical protein [Acidimicrobiales bacterium]MYG62830.1 hypothetical protein [Acidimicrobiales bacterium]MYJ48080.1 hypothetical protein [Acidimicrobiales bacterium]
MTSPVETTAAMTAPAEQHDPASAADSPVSGAGGTAGSVSAAPVSASGAGGEQMTERQELSLKFVVTLFGGLLTALLAALVGLMMWQFNSLGARIDANGARSDRLGTELRAEMQAGFSEINVVLLDHTDRLARLEAAAGLPRPSG